MFDSLPETRARGVTLGRGSFSTSMLAHAVILSAIAAVAILARVDPGPLEVPLPRPPKPIDFELSRLGDNPDAGGQRKKERPKARPRVPETPREIEQPSRTPDPSPVPAVPETTVEPAPVGPDPLSRDDGPAYGGEGTGPGSGSGDEPGTQGDPSGVPWGTGPPGGPPSEQEIFLPGGEVRSPVIIRRVEPVYPPVPLRAAIEGTVVLEGVIGTDGRVESIRIIKSSPLFDRAAVQAVEQWLYRPARLGNRAVKVYLQIRVEFRLR